MHGSAVTKVARLAGSFLKTPWHLPRYIQHNILRKNTPFDLELPWFPYEAIDFLDSFLNRNMNVLELGSGGSTLFFAKRAKYVHSIENSYYWWSKLAAILRARNISNVYVDLHPFDFEKPDGLFESSYIHSIPKVPFDVIVIDGTEEWISVRPQQYFFLEKLVNPGGLIIVDDSWRYPDIDQKSHAKNIRIFQSPGPCRPGVSRATGYFF